MTLLRPTRVLPATAVLAAGLLLLSIPPAACAACGANTSRTSPRSHTTATAPLTHPAAATPVLVELFTSEGCSSCPPADDLLARLQREQPIPGAEILALEEHVDYWDSLGWRDRFSSSLFTSRQSTYVDHLRLTSEYTPQMVVDGDQQLNGSDIVHALRAIAQAAAAPKLTLAVSALVLNADHITGKLTIAHPTASMRGSGIYAALVEPSAATKVLTGENTGQTLHHISIVRTLQRIGTLTTTSHAPLKFSITLPPSLTGSNLRVVIFLQRRNQGAILGAVSSAPIPATPALAAELSSPQ